MSDPHSESVIHVAGPVIEVGPQVRQRCAWCGAVLIDDDLTAVAFAIDPDEPDRDPTFPTWEPGKLIEVYGGGEVTSIVDHDDGDLLPVNACARLPHDVTGSRQMD